MQKLLFVLLVLLGVTAKAQVKVPAKAITYVKEKYPSGEVDWSKEASNYKAEVATRDDNVTLSFNSAGNWLETRSLLEEDDLPLGVVNTLEDDYPDHYVESVEYVVTPKEKFYKLVITDGDTYDQLRIASNGIILDTKVLDEEKEDEEWE